MPSLGGSVDPESAWTKSACVHMLEVGAFRTDLTKWGIFLALPRSAILWCSPQIFVLLLMGGGKVGQYFAAENLHRIRGTCRVRNRYKPDGLNLVVVELSATR